MDIRKLNWAGYVYLPPCYITKPVDATNRLLRHGKIRGKYAPAYAGVAWATPADPGPLGPGI